jgi:glycosyltransferase involved in cell wall biosynthesis
MKLYYWSPFFSNVATEKAVVNSIESVIKFSKKKISPYLLDVIGEWDSEKKKIQNKNIFIKDVLDLKLIKYLPKYGFFKSRLSYVIVLLLSVFKLHKLLKKEKPDFIIVHLMTFIPLLLLLLFNYETKFILRISGYPKLNFLRSFFWKIVGKKIFLVTTPTKLTLNLLCDSKIFDSNKIKYLPDPVLNLNEIREKKIKKKESIEKEVSSENTIISIGRLTHQKNFDFLILAFKEINKKYPHLNLFILGDGEERKKLENLIKRINLEDKIFLVGHKKNIYDYLKESKMFVLTSLWEDPGFVLIEAGYMNKIVFSSNCINGPKELLENEKNGFFFKSNSFDDFLKKFDEIINTDKKLIFKKKLSFKKKIREFTLFNHYRILNSLLIKNEN